MGDEEATALQGKRVCVLVQGDIGRSPRMLNHALELAARSAEIHLVGIDETPLPRSLTERRETFVHGLGDRRMRDRAPRGWFLPATGLDLGALGLETTRILQRVRPDLVLAQIPPSVSAVTVAATWTMATRVPLVLDWHNLGGAQLRATRGQWLGALALHEHERWLARNATAHLAVSEGLGDVLLGEFGVKQVSVLPDRPTERFVAARENPAQLGELRDRLHLPSAVPTNAGYTLSTTSFSADEDLDLLLRAAHSLDAAARSRGRHVVILVSGKGPGQAAFVERAAALGTSHVHVRAVWVDGADFPRLVAGARLGLCLHDSSSGFDVPIKIPEFLGAGVPVLALRYGKAVEEALGISWANRGVETDTDAGPAPLGRLFRSAPELCDLFLALLLGDDLELTRLRNAVRTASIPGWEDSWRETALPVLRAAFKTTGS